MKLLRENSSKKKGNGNLEKNNLYYGTNEKEKRQHSQSNAG